MKDLYEILEVPRTATADEIKKSYRRLSKKHHPDVGGDVEKFKEISAAYEVLSDPKKRKEYDHYGSSGGFQGGGRGFSGDINVDEFMKQFFGGRNPYEQFFRGQTQQKQSRRTNKGSNLRIKIAITLEEVCKGVEKNIKLPRLVSCESCKGNGSKDGNSKKTCSTCNGSGSITKVSQTIIGHMQTTSPCTACGGLGEYVTEKCTKCKGNGATQKEEVIKINIPPGVIGGNEFSIQGQGNAAVGGGIPGDLLVLIEELEHEKIKRDGANLFYEHFITFPDAVFGTHIQVPTFDGEFKFNIESGTPSGKVFRLKEKGVPYKDSWGREVRGDFLVKVNVYVPKEVSDEEKKVLEEMKKLEGFKIKE